MEYVVSLVVKTTEEDVEFVVGVTAALLYVVGSRSVFVTVPFSVVTVLILGCCVEEGCSFCCSSLGEYLVSSRQVLAHPS